MVTWFLAAALGPHCCGILSACKPISSLSRSWAVRVDGGKAVHVMSALSAKAAAAGWLEENGARELELLLRVVVYHPSNPVFITDDEGNSRDASVGLGKLLGLSREEIIGRPVDDFAAPGNQPQVSQFLS